MMTRWCLAAMAAALLAAGEAAADTPEAIGAADYTVSVAHASRTDPSAVPPTTTFNGLLVGGDFWVAVTKTTAGLYLSAQGEFGYVSGFYAQVRMAIGGALTLGKLTTALGFGFGGHGSAAIGSGLTDIVFEGRAHLILDGGRFAQAVATQQFGVPFLYSNTDSLTLELRLALLNTTADHWVWLGARWMDLRVSRLSGAENDARTGQMWALTLGF